MFLISPHTHFVYYSAIFFFGSFLGAIKLSFIAVILSSNCLLCMPCRINLLVGLLLSPPRFGAEILLLASLWRLGGWGRSCGCCGCCSWGCWACCFNLSRFDESVEPPEKLIKYSFYGNRVSSYWRKLIMIRIKVWKLR